MTTPTTSGTDAKAGTEALRLETDLDFLAIEIGAEVRRRNRVGDDDERGSISTACENAATSLVINALNDCGFGVVRRAAQPEQPALGAEPVAEVAQSDFDLIRLLGSAIAFRRLARSSTPPPPVSPDVAALQAENERLRQIVSDCAAALPNGAFCSPSCSLEFMAQIPNEIRLVCERLTLPKPGEADGALVEAHRRLTQSLDDFDREVEWQLSTGSERADLWDEIDVNIEDLRIVLAAALRQHTRSKALSDLAEIDRDLLGKEGYL